MLQSHRERLQNKTEFVFSRLFCALFLFKIQFNCCLRKLNIAGSEVAEFDYSRQRTLHAEQAQ